MLYYIEKFFNSNLNQYDKINIDFPIGLFIFLLIVTLCLTVFFIHFKKKYLQDVLFMLVRYEGIGEENSKTVSELFLNPTLMKLFVSYKGQFASFVKIAGRKKLSYEDYIKLTKEEKKKYDEVNFNTAKFYIPENQLDAVKNKIEKENVSIFSPVLVSVLFIVILILLIRFLPNILEFINSII